MRLDIVAEGPVEPVLSAFGMLPESVVRVVWGFSMARTVLAAVELGVFDALAAGPARASSLAETLGYDEGGLDTLLRALNGFGMLKRTGTDTYSLRKEAARYLTDSHGTNWSDAVRFGAILDVKMRQLSHAVRTGEREDFHATLAPDEWDAYLRGLGAMSGMVASEVVRKVKRGPERPLLDIGGGHGGFSAAFCRKYPELEATVLDLAGAIEVGSALVADSDVAGRVHFVEGDARSAALGDAWGTVLVFNLLHNLPEDDARALVHNAAGALAEGGTLAVLEGQHAGRAGNLSFQEGFGELLFWVLSSSRTWPAPLLQTWMEEAGLTAVKRRKLLTLPGSVLLTGTRR